MTAGPGARLLEPALLARLERLQLSTRRRLAGIFPGEHRSTRTGSSPDFCDYRQYTPGDDFRRVDYSLYARLDILLIRLYEAADELQLNLLIDTSGSMGLHGKMHQAKRIAAALGFVALMRRDPVKLFVFPVGQPAPRFLGRESVGTYFDQLARLSAGGETDFALAVSRLLSQGGPSGLTVLISDLLTPEWTEGLSRLPAMAGDLAVIHILAPEELSPEFSGDFDLVDREDGSRVEVSLSADTVGLYRQQTREWADQVATGCRRQGAAYLRLSPSDDLEALLLGAWQAEGILR